MTTINVKLSQSYDIIIAPGAFELIGGRICALLPGVRTAAIVTDSNVGELYLRVVRESLSKAGLSSVVYCIAPGESSKCASEYIALLNFLADSHFTKSDAIIALGGGVVGDLAGFAAATYLRGVPFIQVPTSLLAMVDSSVGGKTAIDLEAGKNLVGAFYQPILVICDTNALRTLPRKFYNDGMAEVIKYGMLGSTEFLNQVLQMHEDGAYEPLIATCIRMKRDIVENDEFDKGERKLLNFGHTIGHAIEKISDYKIPHGEAVAIGMAIMTRASCKQKLCPPECLDVLLNLLSHFNLPTNTGYSASAIYEAALRDKKRDGEFITIIVPTVIGKCELREIPVESLLNWIEMGLNP